MTTVEKSTDIAAIPEKDPEVMTIVDVANKLTITNYDEYLFVDTFLIKTSALKKRIVGRWEKAKKAAKAAHAAICDSEGAELGLAEEAYTIAKKLKIGYEEAKEAERKAEEDRLNKIAQEKAEAEAKEAARLQKIKDDRLAVERQIEIDRQAKAAAEAAAKAEKEGNARAAQKILDYAADAEKKALDDAASEKKRLEKEREAAANRPVYVAPVKIAQDLPKSQTNSQTRWSAVVGGVNEDGSKRDALFVLKAVQSALKFMEKAKTPAAMTAAEDLRQAEKDIAYMVYNQVAVNKLAVAGSPYVNGVLKLGGVAFSSRKV